MTGSELPRRHPLNVSGVLLAGRHPGLIAVTCLSAFAFGWAALVLPWRTGAPLAGLAWGLASLHACAGLALALRSERSTRALRWLALASLAAAAIFTLSIAVTSWQMIRMYGALGWGLTVALVAIGWLLLLATLPLGVFLLHRARHDRG